ncbi:DNA polymerase III subunit chi [bacterium]|nr:DNA polymerase III subunit chi [bacterium]
MTATAVFYHLIRSGRDETVLTTVTRALAAGWRVMIRAPEAGLLRHLDDRLWLGPEEGFLPHGLQGGPQDADQPVLLGAGPIGNAARGLMLLAGAGAARDEVAGLERIWVLFDGSDTEAVATARQRWTEFTGWGLAAQYWSDESGAWVKKTERSAAG